LTRDSKRHLEVPPAGAYAAFMDRLLRATIGTRVVDAVSVLTERKMESRMLIQAVTWMNSASAAGIAAAAALSGTVIESWGGAAGFGCAAIAALVVAAAAAAFGQRSLK
jgi:predicted MFS family arabinose efflux permease